MELFNDFIGTNPLTTLAKLRSDKALHSVGQRAWTEGQCIRQVVVTLGVCTGNRRGVRNPRSCADWYSLGDHVPDHIAENLVLRRALAEGEELPANPL